MAWYHVILILLAGFAAGVINTLAGSGSVVTISLLVFLGLDPKTANGTNRIGVLLQSITGAKTFIADRQALPRDMGWQIVPTIAGSILGSFIAAGIDERAMGLAIGWLFVVLLGLILLKPSKWMRQVPEVRDNHRSLLSVAMFFAIGVYGGFIQAGVGIFLLAALVLYAGHTLNTANALKLIAVTVFTVPALIVFVIKGQVVWSYGLLMAAGQMLGAWVAARFAMNHPQANLWVRRLLIAVIIASIIKFLNLYPWAVHLLDRG